MFRKICFLLSLPPILLSTLFSTDAKQDVVRGVDFAWSSIHTSSGGDGWHPIGVWYAPIENNETIKVATDVLMGCIPCAILGCKHPMECTSTIVNGTIVFQRHRPCSPPERTAIFVADKHYPSILGLRRAGFPLTLIDPFHGYCAFSKKLNEMGIRGVVCDGIQTAFRFWTRSDTDECAFILRREFMTYVTSLSKPEQAVKSPARTILASQAYELCNEYICPFCFTKNRRNF
jgi:hypothetical protein